MKKLVLIFTLFWGSNMLFGQTDPIEQFDKAYAFGEAKDYKNALIWYQKSADQNYDYAQYNLGYYYKVGKGTPINPEKSFFWLKKASDQGLSVAKVLLAYFYMNGGFVEVNFATAQNLLQKPADEGELDANRALGFIYEHGDEYVKIDRAKSLFYYQKEGAVGTYKAAHNAGYLVSTYENEFSRAEMKSTSELLDKGLAVFIDQKIEDSDEVELADFTDFNQKIQIKIVKLTVADKTASMSDLNEAKKMMVYLLDEATETHAGLPELGKKLDAKRNATGKKEAAENYLAAKTALEKLEKTPQNAENLNSLATDYTKNIVILANWLTNEFADPTKKTEAKSIINRAKITIATVQKNIEAARVAAEKKEAKRLAKISRQQNRAYPFVGLNISPFFRSASRGNFGGHIDFRKPRRAHSFGYAKIEKQFDWSSNGREWAGFNAFYGFKKFTSRSRVYKGVLLEYADKSFKSFDYQLVDPVNGQISAGKLSGEDRQYAFLINYGVQRIGFLKYFGYDLWLGFGVRYNQISFKETADFATARAIGVQIQDDKAQKFFDIRKKENQFLPQIRVGMSFGINFAPKRSF